VLPEHDMPELFAGLHRVPNTCRRRGGGHCCRSWPLLLLMLLTLGGSMVLSHIFQLVSVELCVL
jgi:hypothetical protein